MSNQQADVRAWQVYRETMEDWEETDTTFVE